MTRNGKQRRKDQHTLDEMMERIASLSAAVASVAEVQVQLARLAKQAAAEHQATRLEIDRLRARIAEVEA